MALNSYASLIIRLSFILIFCISNLYLNNAIPDIIAWFEPDERVIYFDASRDVPERMIFEIEGKYRDFEEDHLKNLDLEIKQSEVKFMTN